MFPSIVLAEDPTPTVTPTPSPDNSQKQYEELQGKIKDLESKLSNVQAQGKTLSSQISSMDSQINLTQLRMNSAKGELSQLNTDISSASKKISTLEDSLNNITKVLLKRIVATYQMGSVPPLQVLMSSNSIGDFVSRANYLKIVQAHDKRLIYDTQQARNDYENQKIIFEGKKQKVEALKVQLEKYAIQVDREKKSKQALLEVTKNDETKYQALLKEARTQISSFKSFATSQVGSGESILPAQASPDGWYYNQRDERWGRKTMGTSSEQTWQVGCLATSMAMVMKKKGENVTPSDVVGNSSYFFSNTAYMLIPWGGGKFTSVWNNNLSEIDGKLASGSPVIVGVRAGPYGTHFIVLKSGSGGSYTMNDPWHGPDLNFSSYYSTGQIFQYGYYKG